MALKVSELSWQIVKRDGRMDRYNFDKISKAIHKAVLSIHKDNEDLATEISAEIAAEVETALSDMKSQIFEVEAIQDLVEHTLMAKYPEIAKSYILYRQRRSEVREKASNLMQTYNDIVFTDAKDSDLQRENANVDGNTAMGTMLKIGSESAKEFAKMYLLKPEHARAHSEGDIHIHDLDFMPTGTLTCCQIDIDTLFKSGFSTGHGHLREPQDISSYGALAAIAIQSNQNDQHGGQSIPNFDYGLAKGVHKTFIKSYRETLAEKLAWELDYDGDFKELVTEIKEITKDFTDKLNIDFTEDYKKLEKKALADRYDLVADKIDKLQTFAHKDAYRKTEKKTYQSMEAFLHNLNTMHSRAGAQVPFSSINYGTDTSTEGRMVTKQLLLATEAGLGNGETPIFPIQIFKVKEGVNYNPEDPNYDLIKLSFRVSATRLFPNYVFLDAPFNKQYYKEGHPESEVVSMGCRTRVMGSVHPESDGIAFGRGNISFSTINLPRLGIEHKGDIAGFFQALDEKVDLVVAQLHERYLLQARKKVKNFPFLMGQGIWFGAKELGPEDEVREVLKHGTLTCGFIGLAECLTALVGAHHGESEEAQNLGIEIVRRMRARLDEAADRYRLNYSLIATPAEGLSGRFTRIDKKIYGEIPGVTDREYYTNSYHVPVHYDISAYDKIVKEGPYHALCNAGHISYIELDGAAKHNLEAFEQLIRAMKENNIGYGSVNHPIDRDPLCGYTGIIDDVCPGCGRDATADPQIERIRRITGYLVGTMDKWNDGKQAEERDRVKHGIGGKSLN